MESYWDYRYSFLFNAAAALARAIVDLNKEFLA
jgi:hypothetical protein